jgi:hypothetical protein
MRSFLVARGNRSTTLYRYFDSAGRLIYVGITDDAGRRGHQHAATARWWHLIASATFEHFGTREEAELAERRAIVDEQPVYNIAWAIGMKFYIKMLPPHRLKPSFYRLKPSHPETMDAHDPETEEGLAEWNRLMEFQHQMRRFLWALEEAGWPDLGAEP